MQYRYNCCCTSLISDKSSYFIDKSLTNFYFLESLKSVIYVQIDFCNGHPIKDIFYNFLLKVFIF